MMCPQDISTLDEKAPYFAYSATLRISGEINSFDAISNVLGLKPTHTHRKGEQQGRRSSTNYKEDSWQYTAPVAEECSLDEHIQTLWAALEPHKEHLLQLKQSLHVDVFCGYRTNHWGAGFEVEPKTLAMFVALQIPFGVSVIVA